MPVSAGFFYNLDWSWEENRWFIAFLLGSGLAWRSWGFCSRFALKTCTWDSACWITLLLIARLRICLDKKNNWHFSQSGWYVAMTNILFILFVKNSFFHLSPQLHFSSVLMKQGYQFHYNFVYIEENEKTFWKCTSWKKTWRMILMSWETSK